MSSVVVAVGAPFLFLEVTSMSTSCFPPQARQGLSDELTALLSQVSRQLDKLPHDTPFVRDTRDALDALNDDIARYQTEGLEERHLTARLLELQFSILYEKALMLFEGSDPDA